MAGLGTSTQKEALLTSYFYAYLTHLWLLFGAVGAIGHVNVKILWFGLQRRLAEVESPHETNVEKTSEGLKRFWEIAKPSQDFASLQSHGMPFCLCLPSYRSTNFADVHLPHLAKYPV